MYTLFLVEDEALELELLRDHIDWAGMDIQIAGSARNGKRAWERIRTLRPDIVLTDIRMPIMDGLRLAERIREQFEETKIVFLSGHDEFVYVKSALEAGAVGYLLKPIDPQELAAMMDKVKAEVDKANMLRRSKELLMEKQVELLLSARDEAVREQAWNSLTKLAPSVRHERYVSGLIVADGPLEDGFGEPARPTPVRRPEDEEMAGLLRAELKAAGAEGVVVRTGDDRWFVAVRADERDHAAPLWPRLLAAIRSAWGVAATIGVCGRPALLLEAPRLRLEAGRAASERFYLGHGCIVYAEDVRPAAGGEDGGAGEGMPDWLSPEKLPEAMEEAAAALAGLAERRLPEVRVKALLSAWLSSLSGELAKYGDWADRGLGDIGVWRQLLDECGTFAEMKSYVYDLLSAISAYMAEKQRDRHEQLVLKVAELIREQYAQPLTIDDLAGKVYLSPNYLRALFKEKQGCTIHEYLTQVRLQKALELLRDRRLRIKDVAKRVGYDNTSYFCSSFTKRRELRRMNTAKSFYRPFRALAGRIRYHRLRSKLFLVYLLVSIVPISFLVGYSYHTVREQLINQAVVNIDSMIDQINNNIGNRLDMYAQIATLLYLDNQMRNYLLYRYQPNDLFYLDAYDYINQTLYKILAANPNLKSISIYTDNRTLHSDGMFVRYLDALPEAMKKKIFQAEGKITPFIASAEKDGEKTITLARSLNYLSLNYPYGILTMEIGEREIYSLIEKENKNKTIFVADEHGNVITSGLKGRTIRHLSELGESGDTVMTKRLSNGWQTVVLLPYDTLLGEAKKASASMLLISLACIAVAIVLVYVTSKLMTQRLETLIQMIRKVERGSFDLPLRPMGHDEIGQLSFALSKMAAKIRELIEDVYKKELSRNEAEMSSLQAQITPHFLYNTLASISALAIRHHNPQVRRMADDLARFYRISLNKGKRFITIEQEIQLTRHYVSIQKTRFEGLFNIHYELDESLFPYMTLKLIIQPFIENCINHAIWDDESGINIIVRLAEAENDVLISIVDDGMGMTTDDVRRLRNQTEGEPAAGYGIFNVDKRIKLAYGERYGVELFSRLGIGTAVRIRFPKSAPF
ncbi:HAMP domain-containing sensor protein [Paenibacillus sp. 32O-W]|uniref:histidine kinase n=1 Tax=Paenibacillus sp. 32O-W TaxID=1695218 RepID=UPI00071F29EA|nr:histidine kinase [Paenibacillus sp. 32O-W]ALS26486.1 HAMP domain-containing sensor protein [Paenibacillus sp. 32O-W]